MSHLLPLEALQSGESGRIHEIDGQSELVQRLAEMGLHPGATVRMLRPGSPCIVDINHQRLSYRCDDRASILVEVGPVAPRLPT